MILSWIAIIVFYCRDTLQRVSTIMMTTIFQQGLSSVFWKATMISHSIISTRSWFSGSIRTRGMADYFSKKWNSVCGNVVHRWLNWSVRMMRTTCTFTAASGWRKQRTWSWWKNDCKSAVVIFEAKTDELEQHYLRDFGARPVASLHPGGPRTFMIADQAAKDIFSSYLFEE